MKRFDTLEQYYSIKGHSFSHVTVILGKKIFGENGQESEERR